MKPIVLFAILLFCMLMDTILRKKFPKVWRAIQLPCGVIITIFSAVMLIYLWGGCIEVLHSSVETGDKIFFIGFCAIMTVILVWSDIYGWKRWWREYKAGRSEK